MSTKKLISKLDQMNNFHLSQNFISLHFFEKEKTYSKFFYALEDILHRVNVKTLRLPFRKILLSDGRFSRFLKLWNNVKYRRKTDAFSSILKYSFKRLRTIQGFHNFIFKIKKKEFKQTLFQLKCYGYSLNMVRRKFILFRKIMIRNRKQDFQYFFQTLKQASYSEDSPYEIPLNSPNFPFNQSNHSNESNLLDYSLDRPKNIFNNDETSDSKHFSNNRLENVETFQGFGSQGDNILKNSNFNTFYQADKEFQSPEFQLNSYGTFNKFNDSWVRHGGSPTESIKDNTIDNKIIKIMDIREEIEENSQEEDFQSLHSESSGHMMSTIKNDLKSWKGNSGEISNVSAKSDQASLSVEKKKQENNYTVNIDDLIISHKKSKKKFFDLSQIEKKIKLHKEEIKNIKERSIKKEEKKKSRKDKNIVKKNNNNTKLKIIDKKPIFNSKTNDKIVLEQLKKTIKTKKYETKSRVKKEVYRQLEMIQKSKSQKELKKYRFSKLNLFKKQTESMVSLFRARDSSRNKGKTSPSKKISTNNQVILNSKFKRSYKQTKKSKSRSRSRSRIKEVMDQLFNEKFKHSRFESQQNLEKSQKERSLDQVSWNVQNSAILKSDVSVINLQIQNNFQNKMNKALDKITRQLNSSEKSKIQKEKVVLNFSKILDLFEQYLKTILKSGNNSIIVKNLLQNIYQIGNSIKKQLSKKQFKKGLKRLNTDSMLKIIDFLKNILMKNLLKQSSTFDSYSQHTNNFGTISSNQISNTYNSQIEHNVSKKKFSETITMPIYSSEVFKRNFNADQYHMSYKKIGFLKPSHFRHNPIFSEELKNFCILLNYKLCFKLKKNQKLVMKKFKSLKNKKLRKGWKKFPKVFLFLMIRKLKVSIKMLKINNLCFKIKKVKKNSKNKTFKINKN